MKARILTVLAVLAGLSACAGKDGAKEVVRVRIEVGVESGRIGTKAGVADVLGETAPSGSVGLRLVKDGVDVSVRSGESVELETGRYRVTGRYEDTGSRRSLFIGIGYDEPVYVVDADVEIRSDRESYVVPAEYDCWALVLDTEDTAGYLGDGVDMGGFAGSGRYQVAYVTGSAGEWTLTVLPVDAGMYGETEYVMGPKEKGRWYCYHPGLGEASGAFGVGLPDWEAGE